MSSDLNVRETQEDRQEDRQNEPEDPHRWAALIIFTLFSFTNAFQWVTFASIESSARVYFFLNTFQLNLLSMIFMIIYIVFVFFTCTTFELWGVRKGLLIGTGLNALGSILKLEPGLSYPSFTSMMIPQTINAVAQLFVLSTPPLLAAQYFREDARVFANAIASTGNLLGSAAGLLVPALIVRDAVKSQFQILFGIQLGLSCVIFLACVFFLKSPMYHDGALRFSQTRSSDDSMRNPNEDGPNVTCKENSAAAAAVEPSHETTHDSLSDDNKMADEKASLPYPNDNPTSDPDANSSQRTGCWEKIRSSGQWKVSVEVIQTLKTLFTNRDFMFLLGAFCITTGSIWSIASVLAQVYSPFGISEIFAGISGAGNVVVGTVVAYLVGLWVDRYHRYKYPIIICLIGSLIVMVSFIVILFKAPPYTSLMTGLCVFFVIFAGVFQITAVPLCFEFAMEITYPLTESVPGAVMMACSNLTSLIMVVVASVIIGDGVPSQSAATYVIILIVGVSSLGLLCSCFPREVLRRRENVLGHQDSLVSEPYTPLEEEEVREL